MLFLCQGISASPATIEESNRKRRKMDSPQILFDPFQANGFIGQNFTEKYLLSFPLERPTGAYLAHQHVRWVLRLWHTGRIAGGRRTISRGGGLHLESLVRTILVILCAETIKRFLLRSGRGCCRLGGFCL